MTTRVSMAGAWAGGGLVTLLAAADLPLLAWLTVGLVVALGLIAADSYAQSAASRAIARRASAAADRRS